MPKTAAKPAKAPAAAPAKDRIWIELEKPRDSAHAEAMCTKATAMMRRLGVAEGYEFFWDQKDSAYCWGGPMGYRTLSDRGEWFNLDFLSTPTPHA